MRPATTRQRTASAQTHREQVVETVTRSVTKPPAELGDGP